VPLVTSEHYAPPKAANQSGEPIRRSWGLIVLFLVAASIILPFIAYLAVEAWRARTLMAFCKAAQPGITIAELMALEKRHSIDESYLVQAMLSNYIDQTSSQYLEFRSRMYDPDFACAISHDGENVKSVQLLGIEDGDQN
jgi:hypothetical protein